MDIYEIQNAGATVPITVDSVKNTPSYLMTRCTYFSIESSEPTPGWGLHLFDSDIPFVMLGLSGVVTSPPGGMPYFDKPDHLDNLFEAIEQKDELYIDTNDVWLPNILFPQSYSEPQRGQVYRIGFDLFRLAYLLREEINTDQEFLERMKEWRVSGILEASNSETDALMQWNQNQIEAIQEQYHENTLKKLPKKEEL
ncbi:MAG: hypothetical protein ABFS39_17175 [Pseudomonadota bacterium]